MDADAYNAPAPFALGDALVRLQDGDFEVEYEVPLDTLDGAAQRATVDRAVDAIAESPTAIGSQQLFDTVASCVKHAPALSNDACHALLDSVASGMSAVLEEIRGEQFPAEGYWDYRSMSRKPWPEAGGPFPAEK